MAKAPIIMDSWVTPENFDALYPQALRDKYWSLVEWSLKNLFQKSVDAAKKYRTSLEAIGGMTHFLAYHDHPLHVASLLAGVLVVTDEQYARYGAQEAIVLEG
jgi:hypothetical protein